MARILRRNGIVVGRWGHSGPCCCAGGAASNGSSALPGRRRAASRSGS